MLSFLQKKKRFIEVVLFIVVIFTITAPQTIYYENEKLNKMVVEYYICQKMYCFNMFGNYSIVFEKIKPKLKEILNIIQSELF